MGIMQRMLPADILEEMSSFDRIANRLSMTVLDRHIIHAALRYKHDQINELKGDEMRDWARMRGWQCGHILPKHNALFDLECHNNFVDAVLDYGADYVRKTQP